MGTLNTLTEPLVWEELDALQQHSKFLSTQIRQDNERLRVATEMFQSDQLNEDDSAVFRKLQEELILKLAILDERTRRVRVLLGLVDEDITTVQVDNLERDRLDVNPDLPGKVNYGILASLPRILPVGEHLLQLTPQASTLTPGLVTLLTRKPTEENNSEDDLNSTERRRRQEEKEKLEAARVERELQAKQRMLQILERKRKGKLEQLKHMDMENDLLRERRKKLQSNELADAIRSGCPPQTEEEADRYMKAIKEERDKLNKAKDKVRQEIRQQYRASNFLQNRNLPLTKSKRTGGRIFDVDVEESLNIEQLALEKAKEEKRRQNKENEKLRSNIVDLLNRNDQLRDKIAKTMKKIQKLENIKNEIEKTKEMEVELGVVEKEMERVRERRNDINREYTMAKEALEEQEKERAHNRDNFISLQETYEARAMLISQAEDEHRKKLELARQHNEEFRAGANKEIETLRPFRSELGAKLIEAFENEHMTKKTVADNILLGEELAAHEHKAEELLSQLREHECKVEKHREKENQLKQVRAVYEKTEHRLNRQRHTNDLKQLELDAKLLDIKNTEKEITELRQTIENLKTEFEMKNATLKQEDRMKRDAQLQKLGRLEIDIASKRGLMRVRRAQGEQVRELKCGGVLI